MKRFWLVVRVYLCFVLLFLAMGALSFTLRFIRRES